MANAFYWKPTVGPIDQRSGHWNGMWQYWSTDGEQVTASTREMMRCQRGHSFYVCPALNRSGLTRADRWQERGMVC